MMMMGGSLKEKGMLNAMPDLSNLLEGDLQYQVDFRQVYATLLQNWLKADATQVLGARFAPLQFV
jgi:uncharacterized protein (DUF1501 family)